LEEKYDIPQEVMHPHAFRHFFAIEFLKRNNNIALLADLLGHGSVNVTQIYLRQSQEQQKKEIDEAVDW
jgi:site-specific recombinase XerD